jgi:hypothetical protein
MQENDKHKKFEKSRFNAELKVRSKIVKHEIITKNNNIQNS